jgi:catechol 2,3-dioxygenase-like lactoylglutathione lyase family enzyme
MLDHIILTVGNVERSLTFYEAALKPLNIKFFLPYLICGDSGMVRERSSGLSKESPIQRPFTGGLWPKAIKKSMNSTGRQYPLGPGTIFHRGRGWNTIRDTTPPMYLTLTGIRSRSSIKASGTSHLH